MPVNLERDAPFCLHGRIFHRLAVLGNLNIKRHRGRLDGSLRRIKTLPVGRSHTDLKPHPFVQIIFIPCGLQHIAGILLHGNLIAHNGLIEFHLIRHIGIQNRFIGILRAVVHDVQAAPAPGDFIKLRSQYRCCNVFVLGRVNPADCAARRTVVIDRLRLHIFYLAHKITVQAEILSQSRSRPEISQRNLDCRIFINGVRPCLLIEQGGRRSPPGLRAFRRVLHHRRFGPLFNFRIVGHPGKFCAAIVLHALHHVGIGAGSADLLI